jgi:hypothetical protein
MLLFDNFDGYSGPNPNNNPICGKQVSVTCQFIFLDHLRLLTESLDGGTTITLTIEDRCVGCAKYEYVAPYSRDFCI